MISTSRSFSLFILASLGLLSFSISSPTMLNLYPWNDKDVSERSSELLDIMRQKMSIDVLGEAALEAIRSAPDQELFLKNLEGITFRASIPPADKAPPQQKELFDAAALNTRLEGFCAVMTADYWNYEWCHKKEMIQFHVEQKGSKFVKAPSWSLGKHHKTAVIRDPSLPNTPITKIVDYFKGGQRCDENNLQRSTEVHIQCCEGTNLPNVQETEAFFADPSPTMSKATLNAIMEPEVCAYQAVVCTPYLCPRGRKDELVPSAQAQAQGTAALLKTYVDFMRHIETVCLVKQEEWWTYEVCFNKGVRQIRFNIEQTVSAEGAIVQKQVLANQYTLGSAPTGIYKNESALIECTSSSGMSSAVLTDSERYMLNHTGLLSPIFLSRRADPLHLTLTFTNGTPCDLDNLNRTTHVDISCGPTSRIVQVIEEQTCEYRIKVDLKLACNLPGFVPQKDHVTKIALELFDKLDDEEEHAEELESEEEEDAAEVTEPQPEAEDEQDETKDEEAAVEEEQQVQEEKEPVTFRFEVLAEGMTREQLTASILHSEATDRGEGHTPQEEYEQGKLDRISERARIGRLMDEHPNLHNEHPEAYQLLEDSVHMLLDIDAAMDRVMEKQQKRDSKVQRNSEKVEVEVSSNEDAVPVDQIEHVQVMEQEHEEQQEGGQKEQDDEKQQQREEKVVAEERKGDEKAIFTLGQM